MKDIRCDILGNFTTIWIRVILIIFLRVKRKISGIIMLYRDKGLKRQGGWRWALGFRKTRIDRKLRGR